MRKILFSPIWAVMMLGLFAWLYVVNPSFIESMRLRYFDQLIVSQEIVPNNIYAVNIDEEALNQYGQWPFPRGEYGAIIEDLYNRGAGLVIFNVLMSEEDRSGQDELLATTLQNYPVIVTMLGTEENKNEPINPGAAIINSDYMYVIPSVPGITANVDVIESNAVGSGIVNTFPEIDGVTRRAPLVFESGGNLYPNITMEVLRVLAGDPSFQIKLSPLGVDKLRIPQFGIIPTNEAGEVWIDWSQGYNSVSLSDLPDDFGGAVVFVGTTASGITQPVATAMGSVFPHEIQAAMLGTVFNESNITRNADAKAWGELTALVAAGIIIIFLSYWTFIGLGVFVITITGLIGGSIYVFNTSNILTDGVTISAMLLLIGLVQYVLRFVDEFLQKQAIKKQFAGYASPEVVRLLQENPSLVKEGMKKEVSIVFSDLRGFTPLGESFGDDVKGLTDVMNGYMDAITKPVLDANGMIIKYIGDASMHIHNAPINDPEHPKNGVLTCLRMLRAVDEFSAKLVSSGKPPVAMGAGINTGLGYIGEMGSTARHSYDILGDAVSTAARLESACKGYGVVLIVGPSTYQATKKDFFYLKLDDLAVKGKNVGLDIYTVLDLSGSDKAHNSSNQMSHRYMHELYRIQKFDQAIKLCEELKGCFNGKMDGYYDIWIERCNYMATQNLPSDWDGIFRATTK